MADTTTGTGAGAGAGAGGGTAAPELIGGGMVRADAAPVSVPPGHMVVCRQCHGCGLYAAKYSKKAQYRQKQRRLAREAAGQPPLPPPGPRMAPCPACSGTGLVEPPVGARDAAAAAAAAAATAAAATVGATRKRLRSVDSGSHNRGIDDHSDQPLVAIVGGGIGGTALALALQQRGMRAVVYEKDTHFLQRSQGYGLTMQQGARALQALGFRNYTECGIQSQRHTVYKPDGSEVGRWGKETHARDRKRVAASRQNVHIPRQRLRQLLANELDEGTIRWGCKVERYEELGRLKCACNSGGGEADGDDHSDGSRGVRLYFDNGDTATADVVVGADGIFSPIRAQKIGDHLSPLQYLGTFVMLGIAPCEHPRAKQRVFQTADGTTRIYAMPFTSEGSSCGQDSTLGTSLTPHTPADGGDDSGSGGGSSSGGDGDDTVGADTTMWQLSFPFDEDAGRALSRDRHAQRREALRRCASWHDPIPQLLRDSPAGLICGYPVYDRDVLSPELCRAGACVGDAAVQCTCGAGAESRVTLLGDAAHPMSPFKGQGANQALLDAVDLARALYTSDLGPPSAREPFTANAKDAVTPPVPIATALGAFETGMLKRCRNKVIASREAASFLHSDIAIAAGDFTRAAAAQMAASATSAAAAAQGDVSSEPDAEAKQ